MKDKGSSMKDAFERVTEEKGFLGKILDKIPGFSGYSERGSRRAADQLLRSSISDRLQAVRLELANVQQELSSDIIKAIDFAEPIGGIDTRLQGLIGKVKDAPVGYAGLFDAVKVKEEDLARVYEFDSGMLVYCDELAAQVGALGIAVREDADVKAAVRTLGDTVQQATHTFNARQEVLAGLNE